MPFLPSDPDARPPGETPASAVPSDPSEALLQENRFLDMVVSSLGAGLSILDRSYRVVWYNAVHESLYGPLARNRGRACWQVVARSPGRCEGCPVEQAFATGETVRCERPPQRLPDGSTRDVVVVATPLRGADGAVDRCLELVVDVSGLGTGEARERELRERLLQSQKLSSLGTMAAGVAHEFNNLLGGILGFASLLRSQAEPGSPMARPLSVIEASTRRAAALTRQLLDFARKGTPQAVDMDVGEVARTVAAIAGQLFDRAIEVRDAQEPGLWKAVGDPSRIEQVLMNLCINARDAMPDGGVLSITAENVEQGARGGPLPARLPQGRYVRVSVSDTGTGIPPGVLARIFEPFFTTKEPGKGTGMGLALVRGIVEEHGGRVDVESGPGRGSVFRVYLPAKRDSAG